MTDGNESKTSPSTALVKAGDSVIARARVHSHRPAEPVWAPLALEKRALVATEPLRKDAVALSLKLERQVGEQRCVVVMSALESGAGVSTAIVDLARAVSRTHDEPILMIDGNLRRPALGSRLGIDDGPGLSEVIHGEASVHEAVYELEPGSLYVMPAGDARGEPSTTLASSHCVALLRSLRLQFGQMFIDTPPLGRYIDGIFLAAQAHYVTLFVEQRKHRRSEVRSIVRELGAVGVSRIGLCLTTTPDRARRS